MDFRAGSSPVARTISSIHNGFYRFEYSIFCTRQSLPCVRGGWAAEWRLIGVVAYRKDNPAGSFADSSLCTREPFTENREIYFISFLLIVGQRQYVARCYPSSISQISGNSSNLNIYSSSVLLKYSLAAKALSGDSAGK